MLKHFLYDCLIVFPQIRIVISKREVTEVDSNVLNVQSVKEHIFA